MWGDLLQVPDIEPDEDFFDLGGHSMLALQLVHELKPLAPDIEIHDIFEFPTVAELAEALDRMTRR
ncbi:phosphopantetheine-binding protein [Streptomyces sp. M19]